MERFDVSIEEFSSSRGNGGGGFGEGRVLVDEEGFQFVCGRRKKKEFGKIGRKEENSNSSGSVRVVERDDKSVVGKSRVPFHIPTIKRTQDEFNILVNNSNDPFQHVWLERSEDGSRVVHPLEKLSVLDFVDRNIECSEPQKPPPLESTPFKLVEDAQDLKELASKLSSVNEFAVMYGADKDIVWLQRDFGMYICNLFDTGQGWTGS